MNKNHSRSMSFPLTEQQKQLYYEWQLRPESSEFNIGMAFKLKNLDSLRFKNAFARVMELIPYSRVRLAADKASGELIQFIDPNSHPKDIRINEIDLRSVYEAEKKAQAITYRLLNTPFSLTDYPLHRSSLIQLDDSEFIFVMCGHHIIGDASSFGVFIDFIARFYNNPLSLSFVKNVLTKLGLSLPNVGDYLRQHQVRKLREMEAAQYWQNRLKEAPLSLDLSVLGRPSAEKAFTGQALGSIDLPVIKTIIDTQKKQLPVEGPFTLELGQSEDPKSGGRLSFFLNKATSDSLRKFSFDQSGRRRSTVFLSLATLFQVTLYRYTMQSDLTVSYPVNIRPSGQGLRQRLSNKLLLGYFVNNALMRTKIDPSQDFLSLLSSVFATTSKDRLHRWLSFSEVVKNFRAVEKSPVDLGVTIGQTKFAKIGLPLRNVEVESLATFRGASQSNLALLFDDDSSENIEIAFEFNKKLLDPDRIMDFAQRFLYCLQGALSKPDTMIKDLPLLTPEEIENLAERCQTTSSVSESTVVDVIERQVLTHSGQVAIIAAGEILTYEELNRKANQFAWLLWERFGVRKGHLVSLGMDRSVDMIVAILGILKLGAAYVPIDISAPRERVEYIAKDLANGEYQANILITQSIRRSQFEGIFPNTCCIDELIVSGERFETSPCPGPRSGDLAYVIYTSGSTGQPKAVLLEHHGIMSRFEWMKDEFGLTGKDVFLQRTPYTFDPSVREFFWPLMLGGKLVLVDESAYKDPRQLGLLVKRHQATVLFFVPDMLEAFLEFESADQCPNLRIATSGGDALNHSTIKKFYGKFPNSDLYNLYGPTEATIFSTYWKCPREIVNSVIPIGRAVSGVIAFILDRNGRLVPPGVPGELVIAGSGLARAYLNQPELTAKHFFSFSLHDGGPVLRAYRTGDLVRAHSGEIEFLGRLDHQVKVRGYRVELGEIEAQILTVPGVKVAVAMKNPQTLDSIIAYFVRNSDLGNEAVKIISGDETQHFSMHINAVLRARLPDYMVPNQLVELNRMPLNSNGKIDKKQLPTFQNKTSMDPQKVPPRNQIEEMIRGCWAHVLNVAEADVGVLDNFFEVGGHSLLLIKLQNLLMKNFSVDLPLSQLYRHATIEGSARYIAQLVSEGQDSDSLDKIEQLLLEQDLQWQPRLNLINSLASSSMQHILLTGANGFLGVHLLDELLQNTQANVHCVIRGRTTEEARERLERMLLKFDLGHWVGSPRIEVHLGDLAKPELGLSSETLNFLTFNIGAIYHNGAFVHHLHTYEMLRQHNVLSTQWLIEFALRGRKKSFHYVSTRGVVTREEEALDRPAEGPNPIQPSSRNGYVLTKWVAEHLVWNAARKQSLVANIYRLGLLAGHSTTGKLNSDSYHMALFVRGACQMQRFPLNISTEMTPVDVVAKAIVSLSKQDFQHAMLFNLQNPNHCTQTEFLSVLGELGFTMTGVNTEAFRKSVADISPDNAYYIYKDRFLAGTKGKNVLGETITSKPQHSRNSQEFLAMLGVEYPQRHDKILKQMFHFWLESGFLNAADGSDTRAQ